MTTTATMRRQPLFRSIPLGEIVLDVLDELACEECVQSLACVVMPDHVHWLLSLRGAPSLSDVMRRFKGRAARRINLALGQSTSIWQAGFHDHAVRNDESLERLARYLIENPVRAGLVDQVCGYPLWRCAWKVFD